ncbi:MAG TPA: DUF3140 domain-containing protein [Mycobacteriales bacterium]|nr:DUF3140 domain-containing protein [Mycobacteriales bacterium]
MAEDEVADAYDAFTDAVNMTKSELTKWLDSDESRSVGMTADGDKKTATGGTESQGHEAGRMIVALLEKKKSDLDHDDVKQMKRVAGYVHRHLAQKPGQDVEHSRWRYSLMNWGHDPLKK